jgi:hypothetical protein
LLALAGAGPGAMAAFLTSTIININRDANKRLKVGMYFTKHCTSMCIYNLSSPTVNHIIGTGFKPDPKSFFCSPSSSSS